MQDTFRVVIDMTRSNAVAGLLDMMRYDGNTVVSWHHGNSGLVPDRSSNPFSAAAGDPWTITLRGRCTRDRWSSFGLPVFDGR